VGRVGDMLVGWNDWGAISVWIKAEDKTKTL
jgi:hypothetical protein